MEKTFFLDTNVVLYAVGRDHNLKAYCETIMEKIKNGDLEARTNTEVIQEIIHLYTRRREREKGIRVAEQAMCILSNLIAVRESEIQLAMTLMDKYKALNIRDAIHVSTMLTNGITKIISADKDFDDIKEIKRVDPQALTR